MNVKEIVKNTLTVKNAKRFAKCVVNTTIGSAAMTLGAAYTIAGIEAMCLVKKPQKEFVATSAVGAGLMYSGYKTIYVAFEQFGCILSSALGEDDLATQIAVSAAAKTYEVDAECVDL